VRVGTVPLAASAAARSAIARAASGGEEASQADQEQLGRPARLARAGALDLEATIRKLTHLDTASSQERAHLGQLSRLQLEGSLGVPTSNDFIGHYLDPFSHGGGTLPRIGLRGQEFSGEDLVNGW